MTTTAFDDQFTAAPEPVREPYDTVAILRRNIAALEVALKQQTERAEANERNARRYLALRKVGVQVPGYDFVKFDWSLDAAADRLLEGGE